MNIFRLIIFLLIPLSMGLIINSSEMRKKMLEIPLEDVPTDCRILQFANNIKLRETLIFLEHQALKIISMELQKKRLC